MHNFHYAKLDFVIMQKLKIIVMPFWILTLEPKLVHEGNESFLWSLSKIMYIFVHILFQKVRALVSSMTVEDSKITATGPSTLEVRLSNIHNDGYTIFIIIFDKSMKCINCISFYGPIRALYKLDGFYFRDLWCPFLIHIHQIIFNDDI